MRRVSELEIETDWEDVINAIQKEVDDAKWIQEYFVRRAIKRFEDEIQKGTSLEKLRNIFSKRELLMLVFHLITSHYDEQFETEKRRNG